MEIYAWPGLSRVPAEFISELVREAKARQWDANSLLAHLSIESGFDPCAGSNSSTAGGLAQMTDAVARRYAGVSASQLRRKSALEQLPAIIRYFDLGVPLSGSDFRVLGFSRDAKLLTAPDSYVLYPAGSRGALANPAYLDDSGNLTLGTIRRKFDDFQARYWGKPFSRVEAVLPSCSSAGPAIVALGTLGAVLFMASKRKK